MKKRLLALLLALFMVASLLPMTVLAAEDEEPAAEIVAAEPVPAAEEEEPAAEAEAAEPAPAAEEEEPAAEAEAAEPAPAAEEEEPAAEAEAAEPTPAAEEEEPAEEAKAAEPVPAAEDEEPATETEAAEPVRAAVSEEPADPVAEAEEEDPARAEGEEEATVPPTFDYTGNIPAFIKEDGTAFGMMKAVTGTTITLSEDGESIDIIYNANKGKTYKGFYLNASNSDDTTWAQDSFYEATDGNYAFTLSKEYCGKAVPVAVVKPDGSTASDQYYLAIPSADKLPYYMPADDADVYVTISNKGTLALARAKVTVKDIDKDGKLTYDEALAAAHEAYCPAGTAGYSAPSGFVQYLWGIDTKGSCWFVLNNEFIPNGVAVDTVAKDDELVAAIMADTAWYSDYHSYFTERTKTVAAGEEFTLTLIVTPAPFMGYDDMPSTGLKGGIWANGSFNEIDGAVADAEGKISLSIDKPGRYVVSASGTLYNEDFEIDMPIIAPACVVTVTGKLDLTIDNKLNMFKAVTAHLDIGAEETALVFALSGSGYHYLYKGTYEQAVANGDKRENWITGYQNDDGKWEFRIPVAEGESYIPVVAISQKYLDNYDQGLNDLARSFYPRQVEIDTEAATLVLGDYETTKEVTVNYNGSSFPVASAALRTVGGINSNSYKTDIVLTMGSDAYDKAYVGTAEEAAAAEKTVAIGTDRVANIKVRWIVTEGDPESIVSLLDKPFIVSFHSPADDVWYEKQFTVSEVNGTLRIIDALPAVDDAVVYVTVSNAGSLALARETVTVKDVYRDGVLTFDEAMIATHEQFCEGGYEESGNWVSKLWDVSGQYLFYINDAGLSSGVEDVVVADGDELVAAVLSDAVYYSDIFTYFTEKTVTAVPGQKVALTVKASSFNFFDEAGAGLTVGRWVNGELDKKTAKTTDADGRVELTFEQEGKYIITAEGTMKDNVTISWTTYETQEMDCQIITPVCIVTVPSVKDGWNLVEGVWYYYKDQNLQTGWQQVNGKWYYLGESGAMQTGWQKVNGKWYYLAPDGAMQTGWQKINGKWYYLAPGGAMLTGWQQINGKWYYLAPGGAMLTGWQQINGKWYYLAPGGAMLTGWQKVNGTWYYLAESGAMVTGWQKINGTWYYFAASGAMQTGWQKINGTWYYLAASGAMATGWLQINGTWYYFTESGAMVTGTQMINGKVYKFSDGGAWIPS